MRSSEGVVKGWVISGELWPLAKGWVIRGSDHASSYIFEVFRCGQGARVIRSGRVGRVIRGSGQVGRVIRGSGLMGRFIRRVGRPAVKDKNMIL